MYFLQVSKSKFNKVMENFPLSVSSVLRDGKTATIEWYAHELGKIIARVVIQNNKRTYYIAKNKGD